MGWEAAAPEAAPWTQLQFAADHIGGGQMKQKWTCSVSSNAEEEMSFNPKKTAPGVSNGGGSILLFGLFFVSLKVN